jgi:hypothetical protein
MTLQHLRRPRRRTPTLQGRRKPAFFLRGSYGPKAIVAKDAKNKRKERKGEQIQWNSEMQPGLLVTFPSSSLRSFCFPFASFASMALARPSAATFIALPNIPIVGVPVWSDARRSRVAAQAPGSA